MAMACAPRRKSRRLTEGRKLDAFMREGYASPALAVIPNVPLFLRVLFSEKIGRRELLFKLRITNYGDYQLPQARRDHLLMRVIAAAYKRPALNVLEAHLHCFVLEVAELVRSVVTRHRQVVF